MSNKSIIRKTLKEFVTEELNKITTNIRYHFSYDTIEKDKTFEDYAEAKKFLLYVLSLIEPLKINSYNESSLIIEFKDVENFQKRFPEYLSQNLNTHFYFTLSLIESLDNKKTIWSNQNNELDNNFQEYLHKLDFSSIKHKVVKF